MSHFNTGIDLRPDLGGVLIVVLLRKSRGFSKQSAEVRFFDGVARCGRGLDFKFALPA
jgi:hypothetical protein